jgi:SAM-dependent methyltransferase
MFFADPVAAFKNLARAARPGARLVLLVWQNEERNEWATAIRQALTGGTGAAPASGMNAFSLADPDVVRSILDAAGFLDVSVTEVREPVYYGPDVAAALDFVRDMKRPMLARLDAAAAERTLVRLRETLVAHETGGGVFFDSRAWLVTAERGPA